MKYKIQITYAPYSKDNEVVSLETNDIEWTMKQYQRNRQPFTWKIIEEKT